MRRNISNLISVILFGRLAVESRYQLCCFGCALIRPALERTWQGAEIDGSRVMLTEPNDDDFAKIPACFTLATAFFQCKWFVDDALPTLNKCGWSRNRNCLGFGK